ncbi:uncharacterized protein Z518_09027 [Rhinocladiella mackenziei CBS 650.93]|uniref:Zn(2)-C6 fungal-type domain-containing protein n=1 Tax=Rhinocladiella mackenziei CBS 650.93 TaxID=1442369 RepID=A0A0D2FGY8_9EURO|nr:uncharacterized protein Z518_09027 [Rhinocladiella mackenziei CBS 650.93]KIX01302.1 hypothetical protein Z518_09027 [Rhinocladiella mackenziei CBS 650.93]
MAPRAGDDNASNREKPGGRKRTRVPLACDVCRGRKIRCNGVKPVCGKCQRRGFSEAQCVYSTVVNPSRNDSQREYIKVLHDRIRLLEGASSSLRLSQVKSSDQEISTLLPRRSSRSNEQRSIHRIPGQSGCPPRAIAINEAFDHPGSRPTSISASPPGIPSQSETSNSNFSGGPSLRNRSPRQVIAPMGLSTSHMGSNEGSVARNGGEVAAVIDEEDQVNAMGAICSIPAPSQSQRESFYGQSSIVSLMNQIPRGLGADDFSGPITSMQPPISRSQRDSITNPPQVRRFHRFSLPSRRIADHLLDHYWNGVHLFYPWIHFPSFLKAYELLWVSDRTNPDAGELSRVGLGGRGCSPTVFHCALNTIFALGCEFSDSMKQMDEHPAGEFMDRVNELLQISLLDEGGLSIVQTLLLLAIYLQSTHHPMRCWGVSGLAYRMAQGIGLHLNDHHSKYNTLEIEMRRRAWHGCLLMDRIVSMTLGRLPTLLESSKIPLFSAIDDEYLDNSSEYCHQPDGTFSRTTFAVHNVKLGEILGQILLQMYAHHIDHDSLDAPTSTQSDKNIRFDSIVALESSLSSFEKDLPPTLRWGDGGVPDDQVSRPFLRQRFILQARTLHVRLMLYRPLFSDFCCRTPPNIVTSEQSSIRTIIAGRCAIGCFEAASELIEVLNRAIPGRLFGAWWFGLFYLVTACMILTLAETCPKLKSELDKNRFTRMWQLSFQTLNFLDDKHPMAGQCVAALQGIRQRAISIHQMTLSNGGNRQDDTRDQPSCAQNDPWITTPQSLAENQKDCGNNWIFQAPSQESYVHLDEGNLQDFSNQDVDFTPMIHGLQSTFGGALIPGSMWQALDQEFTTGLWYEP